MPGLGYRITGAAVFGLTSPHEQYQ